MTAAASIIDILRLRRQQLRREGDDDRIEIGRAGAERDQRVHLRRAAQQGRNADLEEAPARPEQHDAGQHEIADIERLLGHHGPAASDAWA